MTYPIFHCDEVAQIGPYAYDRAMVGQLCDIKAIMKPLGGENRYGVLARNGRYTIVLESTLLKRFERCDWDKLRGIWQPRREAR